MVFCWMVVRKIPTILFKYSIHEDVCVFIQWNEREKITKPGNIVVPECNVNYTELYNS
jgi:hypothetical protein